MRAILATVGLALSATASAADHTTDTPAEVKKAVEAKKAILVDVREQSEWDDGHLKDAVLLPLSALKGELSADAKGKLDAAKPIYLHCGSGKRCLKAAETLKKLGYDARPLKQGYTELLDAGFPKADKK